jgi:hypothetical protein
MGLIDSDHFQPGPNVPRPTWVVCEGRQPFHGFLADAAGHAIQSRPRRGRFVFVHTFGAR